MTDLRPQFLRVVGAHRANDNSFGLVIARDDIPEGSFGAIAPYCCSECGPTWSEPETYCVSEASWGFYGGEPAEYQTECALCGGEEVGDHDDPRLSLKMTKRYSIHRNPSYRE